MITVLGRADSINVRKVLWLCRELALPFTLEAWGMGHRPTSSPEFLALNPHAMVPVLRDGDLVLWESNAICRYLATAHGGEHLLPAEPKARARIEQWMDWQATELNNAWRYAFSSLVRRSPDHQDPQALAQGIAGWNQQMAVLDRQLAATGACVVGDAFTLADVVLGLSTHRWAMAPMARPELPAVARYYEQLSERPGFLEFGRNGLP